MRNWKAVIRIPNLFGQNETASIQSTGYSVYADHFLNEPQYARNNLHLRRFGLVWFLLPSRSQWTFRTIQIIVLLKVMPLWNCRFSDIFFCNSEFSKYAIFLGNARASRYSNNCLFQFARFREFKECSFTHSNIAILKWHIFTWQHYFRWLAFNMLDAHSLYSRRVHLFHFFCWYFATVYHIRCMDLSSADDNYGDVEVIFYFCTASPCDGEGISVHFDI